MVASPKKSLFYFILLLLFIICVNKFGVDAKFIPEDEVNTQIISNKLKITLWRVSRTSCTNGGFNKIFGAQSLSNVTCDCSYGGGTVCHVTHIQLKRLNLVGGLPEEFGNLSRLQEIDLSVNYITGRIPESLTKIPLVILVLMGNLNTGPIPAEIGLITTLEQLVLEDNGFEGPIPKSLGNLKNLQRLVLGANFFNGTLPDTLVNLKNLTELRFNGNMISGKIPSFIGSLTKLTLLDIQGTSMVGPIPSTISSLRNLQSLRISDLDANSIPFPNLTDMTNLDYLILRNCSITGRIPDYIQNLSTLKVIDLSYNRLSGPIPEGLDSLKSLSNFATFLAVAVMYHIIISQAHIPMAVYCQMRTNILELLVIYPRALSNGVSSLIYSFIYLIGIWLLAIHM